jgi:glycosyltransferase involved in cell wall biosynthesis
MMEDIQYFAKSEEHIDILLATYNGELYLNQQIQSIINQSYINWTIIIRDDCSTDSTVSIINEYKKILQDKLIIIDNYGRRLYAAGNFLELLKYSTADYIMFCDQDDYWLPNKMKISLSRIIQYEKKPALVHTDLFVTDLNLNISNKTFWQISNIDPSKNDYKSLLKKNTVTGCSMIINKELKNIIISRKSRYDYKIIMHDLFIALVVSLCGVLDFIKEPTILYRQHSNNEIGLEKRNIWFFLRKIFLLYRNDIFVKRYEQINAILNIEELIIHDLTRYELTHYANLKKYSKIHRCLWLLKNRYIRGSFLDKIYQLCIC